MHGVPGVTIKKDMMSTALFRKLIDDLQEFPEKIKLLRVCGNGEPLLNPELPAMLEYASSSDKIERVELISNGILLNQRLVDVLPSFLQRMIISVEGLNAEDYLRISGVEINFDRFVDWVKAFFHQRRDCTLHIKIHNEAVETEARKERFFSLFQSCADEIFIENLVPMWPELNIECQTQLYRYDGLLIPKQICAQIFKGFQVQADGDAVPCCVDWQRKNLIGNLHRESLAAIWRGEILLNLQLEHLRRRKNELDPCRVCTMNDYCEIDNVDACAGELLLRLERMRTSGVSELK
jgi:radical SAM protein with 4Fe4S-binding SPASM domain